MDLELQAIRDQRSQPVPPRAGLADQLTVTGYLSDVPDATRRCSVSVLGSPPIAGVPALSADYTAATTVRILMSGGVPVQVIGPAGALPTKGSGAIPPPPSAATTQTSTQQTVILPQASGTWRAIRGAWGRWGDADDTSQRSGADPLTGLATYGDQIVSLGAASITQATITLVQSGSSGYASPWAAVVQGSPHDGIPGGAPSSSGSTATVTMPGRGRGTSASADLPADLREALRTGAARGLALVGTAYGTALGAGRSGQAWALTLTYTTTR